MAKLLVAEENTGVRTFVIQVLSGAGYVVTAVDNGEAALAALLPGPSRFAAAILDQVMCGLTGSEVVEHIRSAHPDLPVLLLSGGWSPPLDPHMRFLAKPFAADRLVREVAHLLVPRTTS